MSNETRLAGLVSGLRRRFRSHKSGDSASPAGNGAVDICVTGAAAVHRERPMPRHSLFRSSLAALALATIAAVSGLIASNATRAGDHPAGPCGGDGRFIAIPSGPYIAGSDRAERDLAYRLSAEAAAADAGSRPAVEAALRRDAWFDEEPVRKTQELPAFCIARHPVTNAGYEAFVRDTGRPVPGISAEDYQRQGFLVHSYEEVREYLWQDGTYPTVHAQRPAVLVTLADAQAYAQWAGQRDGHRYRLPSADEWEKAARGTDGRVFPWGDIWREDGGAWSRDGTGRTVPVGSFPAGLSPYGVADTAGNVFEYTSSTEPAPGGGRVVMKGCGFDDLPGFCRPAYRHTRPIGSKHILFGFRLVRE
jgi:toxoflavin biosynthesis protein ToxD